MGAHRGCSEHRTVYRQQRETAIPTSSAINTHSSTRIQSAATEKREKLPPRYPDFVIPVVMDEKQAYRRAATPPPMSARMTRRKGLLPVLAMAVIFAYSVWNFVHLPSAQTIAPIVPEKPSVEIVKELVPLEAHIMSKCPDARVSGDMPSGPGRIATNANAGDVGLFERFGPADHDEVPRQGQLYSVVHWHVSNRCCIPPPCSKAND